MLRIVTDTAADLPAAWIRDYAVELIPINIHFGEKTFLQGVDLTDHEFYRIANETGKIPKTSQPSPGQFVEFSIMGIGEAPISVSSPPGRGPSFELAIRRIGSVTAAALPPQSPINVVKGRVDDVGYLGSISHYHVHTEAGNRVTALRANSSHNVERSISWDDTVWLEWPEDAGVVLTR